jgi:hypothetical protein
LAFDTSSVFERIDNAPETGTEHQGNLRSAAAAGLEFLREIQDSLVRGTRSSCTPGPQRNMPAIVAVNQEAKAPPNIARKARRVRSVLRSGANGAIPPI